MARTRLRTVGLVAVMALLTTVAAISPAAAQRERARAGHVTLFPTDVTIAATQLLANDGFVYFPAESSDGNTFYLARVDQSGQLERAEVPSVSTLVATADRAVWQAAGAGGAVPQGDPATTLIGADRQLDLTSVPVTVAPDAVDVEVAAAGPDGRFWSLLEDVDQGSLVAVSAGLDAPLASVDPSVRLSGNLPANILNPLIAGPDGRMWTLGLTTGPLGLTGVGRVTSFDHDGVGVTALTPADWILGPLWLEPVGDTVWTLLIERGASALAAWGLSADGSTTLIPTSLLPEDGSVIVGQRPAADRRGRLWFTGRDATGALQVAEVATRTGRVEVHTTDLQVLGAEISSVVPTAGGAIAAGLDAAGNLAIARVGTRDRVITTDLQPYFAELRARYPIVDDGRNGAWTQALDDDGDLVIVHVGTRDAITVPTGTPPLPGASLTVGPDGNLWVQQGDDNGDLVIRRVTPRGEVTTFDVGLQPAGLLPEPVADGEGHLWFAASDDDGNTVLVRITATRGRR